MSIRTHRYLPVLALILAGALAPQAQASGFQLREQSASSQGNAFAGASAGAQDISSMFWNPATMSLFDGTQVFAGATYIGVHMDLSGANGTRAAAFDPSVSQISGGPDLPNAVNQPTVPALYVTWAASKDLSLGIAVNAPFGFITNYPDSFIGRYYGLETNLKIIDITPSISYKVNQDWAIGAAFIARKCTATLSNAVDFGAIGAANKLPGFTPGQEDSKATLTGDCWAYGFKVGATWQATHDLRFGLGYQAATTLNVKGNVGYSSIPALLSSEVQNGAASASVDLPATASLGLTYDASPTVSFQGELAWTGWSRFQQLVVNFANGAPSDVTNENWNNTWFGSVGVIWKVTPTTSLKAGLAYDEAPVGDGHRTPRIPDANRDWVSIGAGHAFTKDFTMDVGLTQVFASTVNLALQSGDTPSSPNFFRGNLTGSYKVGATVASVSARYRF